MPSFKRLGIFIHLFAIKNVSIHCFSMIAPETTELQRNCVKRVLDLVYGDENSDQWENRRSEARRASNDGNRIEEGNSILNNIPDYELVYGELGLDALATILDAVGVEKGDKFLDIGSGDGMLVSGASMLFPDYLDEAWGVEIVPNLYDRSLKFQKALENIIEQQQTISHDEIVGEDVSGAETSQSTKLCKSMGFNLGNIYDPDDEVVRIINNCTLAVCFATTWSRGVPGRKLPKLSEALGNDGKCQLQKGARVVVVDGVLDHKKDGFRYEGQFELYCPDTAPFSIPSLYTKL